LHGQTPLSERPILGSIADRRALALVLWLTLVLCCVVGLPTPYLVGIVGIVVLIALLFQRRLADAYKPLAARLFLIAFAVLAACFAISAQSVFDPLRVFNFTALLLFGPFLMLMQRFADAGNALAFARLASAGAIVGFVAAFIGKYGLGWPRAESPIFGAILLANTAVLLGFLSATGVLTASTTRERWFYGLVPLLGVATASITESRGPMLSIAPLVILCAAVIAKRWRVRPLIAIAATFAYLAICAAIIFGINDRVTTIAGVAQDMSSGVAVEDFNAGIRLALYDGGLRAFLEAPIFGHGWARLMTSVGPFLPDGMREFGLRLPHLHNDVIDFAVAAGVVGIAVYLLLIATPLVASSRSPRDSQWFHRMFACAILCTAYIFDGLTDLMFGMEFHDMFYVVVAAIVLAYCRDPVTGSA
jgi:O-antigen ligase